MGFESVGWGLAVAASLVAGAFVASGYSKRFAVGLITAIALALASPTVLGATVLANADFAFIGGAQAVAAGAVLAVLLG
ncbi:hypothetical protein BH20ACT4_BH20ACT4_04510 [soil metagenome]